MESGGHSLPEADEGDGRTLTFPSQPVANVNSLHATLPQFHYVTKFPRNATNMSVVILTFNCLSRPPCKTKDILYYACTQKHMGISLLTQIYCYLLKG